MFNLGWGEIITLLFVGLIVLGPERLPKYAADAGRLLRQLRKMATDASSELRSELGPEVADIHFSDLASPKRMVARYLLEASEDGEPEVPAARRPSPATLADGERPPYDVDAT